MNFALMKNDSPVGNISEAIQLGNELPVSDFEDVAYVPSVDKYFILDVNNARELIIYQLNSATLEIEKSKSLVSYVASGDLKTVEVDPAANSLIINMNQKALVFDPVNFSIAETHKATDYNSQKPNADVYYRGDYIILDDVWAAGEVSIYEKATGIQKFKVQKTTKFFSAIDAGYFYVNGGLYKLESGNFVFQKSIQDSENNVDAPALEFMTFDKKSNSAVFGWYRNAYYLDLDNNSQKYLWGTGDVYEVKYSDDGRPLINSNHFSAGTRSHLYNAQTNELKSINTYGQQSFRYFKGVIFSPTGFYLESDLYIN